MSVRYWIQWKKHFFRLSVTPLNQMDRWDSIPTRLSPYLVHFARLWIFLTYPLRLTSATIHTLNRFTLRFRFCVVRGETGRIRPSCLYIPRSVERLPILCLQGLCNFVRLRYKSSVLQSCCVFQHESCHILDTTYPSAYAHAWTA